MRFADILAQAEPLRSLGDVRLEYEPSLLVGTRRRSRIRGLLPEAAFTAAVGAGATAAALVLFTGAPAGVSAALAAVALGLLWAGAWIERRIRSPRAFVLNFATETLRLEQRARLATRPKTELVPFDRVSGLEVVARRDGLSLELRYRGRLKTTRRAVLVGQVPEAERAALEKMERFLAAALGLRAPDGTS